MDLLVNSQKAMEGSARLFRPRYAWANLGHPSSPYAFFYDTDSCGTEFLGGRFSADAEAASIRPLMQSIVFRLRVA
jgi:hypothetical protein